MFGRAGTSLHEPLHSASPDDDEFAVPLADADYELTDSSWSTEGLNAAFALLSDDCAACPPEATRGALWGAAYRPSAATGVALPPEPAVRVVSWTPRVFVIDDFLSAEECDHLIELSKPGMVYTEGPGHNLVGYKTTLNGWQVRAQSPAARETSNPVGARTVAADATITSLHDAACCCTSAATRWSRRWRTA